MGDEGLGIFSTKHQSGQTGAALTQNTVDDIGCHAVSVGGQQFNIGIVELEKRIGRAVIGVCAAPTGFAAQERTVLSACLSEVRDCDDDVVNGCCHTGQCLGGSAI